MLPGTYSIRFIRGALFEKEFQVLDAALAPIDLSAYTAVQLFQLRTTYANNGGSVVMTGVVTLTDPANGRFKLSVPKATSVLVGTAGLPDPYLKGRYDVNLAKVDGTALIPVSGPWQMDLNVSQ